MLPYNCLVVGHSNSGAQGVAACVLMFLAQFNVFCDLLLNRRTATWNLVVLYNNMEKCEQNLALFSSRNWCVIV